MIKEEIVLEQGSFFTLKDDGEHWILEDKTKRGLPIIKVEEYEGIKEEKGRIYDSQGKGYWVTVRWYYSKEKDYNEVKRKAYEMEEKYRKIREETCPG
ncbi:MAG: hypothetical protein QXX95_04755 [Nitrososphaerales archaeon]